MSDILFCHSGNSGDIVFSIPTINHICGNERKAMLYIKKAQYITGNQFDFVKDLLLQQPSIKSVHPFIPTDNDWSYFNWPGLKYDYDLDLARMQNQRGRIHIVKRYFDTFGIQADHTKPFLKIDDLPSGLKGTFALIHLTPRWNGLQYDWKKIYAEAKEKYKHVFFIGFQSEWLDFSLRFGPIIDLVTNDLLEMARFIRDCAALYCNQGVALTIAQGLGKEYYLVKNGTKTNCHLHTPNEHLLGAEYLASHHTFSDMDRPDSHLQTRFK